MIKAIAIDDEPFALTIIEKLVQGIENIELVKTFSKPTSAKYYIQEHPVDLIFLDIKLASQNGIEFYKSLETEAMVVFTTAYSEFAIEGFELNAVDYILKPFSKERFEKACNKAIDFFTFKNKSNRQGVNCLFVRSEYSLVKIPFSEILYLETLDDYIKIHLLGKKPVLTLMSMKKMLERLPTSDFVRIHRSYIIPINKIESIRGKSVSLGVVDLPIGTSYEKPFFSVYMP